MKLNKTFLTLGLAAALLQMPASSFAQTAGGNRQNPLLTKSSLPFGAPDFSKIQESDYLPAIEAAIREQRANIQKIVNNKKKPNFHLRFVTQLHEIRSTLRVPAGSYGAKCRRCSLAESCMPKTKQSAKRYLQNLREEAEGRLEEEL